MSTIHLEHRQSENKHNYISNISTVTSNALQYNHSKNFIENQPKSNFQLIVFNTTPRKDRLYELKHRHSFSKHTVLSKNKGPMDIGLEGEFIEEFEKRKIDITEHATPLLSFPTEKSESSISDIFNFILLACLYLFQGIPFGLAFGSIPFLLKSISDTHGASYSDIGLFSLASYPYTFKILWSPIVDLFFIRRFGRRKSWIFPMQLMIGLTFLWMGNNLEQIVYKTPLDIPLLTFTFSILILFCATQDVAVDGWALTILSKKNIRFGSAAQTVGLNSGYFLSFTVFLALQSPEFCNKYLRLTPSEQGIVSLNGFLTFWGWASLLLTLIILLKPEKPEETLEKTDLETAYRTLWNLTKLPYMKTLILVLLIHKFGYLANEAISPLKLIEKGFRKEDLALIVLIDFPFQIMFGFLAVKWSSGKRPLRPWLYAVYARHFMAVLGMLVVYFFPPDGVNLFYFILVMVLTGTTSFMSTIMFVSQGSFFAVISDPLIGGTYMTFLHTFSNLGGTWPRYFIFKGVDLFSSTKCILPNNSNIIIIVSHSSFFNSMSMIVAYTCSNEAEKKLCRQLSGLCAVYVDGYYIVAGACMIVGLALMVFFVHRKIMQIEKLPSEKYWRINDTFS